MSKAIRALTPEDLFRIRNQTPAAGGSATKALQGVNNADLVREYVKAVAEAAMHREAAKATRLSEVQRWVHEQQARAENYRATVLGCELRRRGLKA